MRRPSTPGTIFMVFPGSTSGSRTNRLDDLSYNTQPIDIRQQSSACSAVYRFWIAYWQEIGLGVCPLIVRSAVGIRGPAAASAPEAGCPSVARTGFRNRLVGPLRSPWKKEMDGAPRFRTGAFGLGNNRVRSAVKQAARPAREIPGGRSGGGIGRRAGFRILWELILPWGFDSPPEHWTGHVAARAERPCRAQVAELADALA